MKNCQVCTKHKLAVHHRLSALQGRLKIDLRRRVKRSIGKIRKCREEKGASFMKII